MSQAIEQAVTHFEEKKVVERTPIINLNGVYPLSDIRDEQQTGGGSISNNESEYKLSHSTAGDFARLTSIARARYQPGTIGQSKTKTTEESVPQDISDEGILTFEASAINNTATVELTGKVIEHF